LNNRAPSTPIKVRPRKISLALGLIALAAIFSQALAVAQETAQLQIGGGTLDIRFDAPTSPALRQIALDWITRAAHAVTVYYTRFPVREVQIDLHVDPGAGVGAGRASGDEGPHIRVVLGAETTLDDISEGGSDWIMTHEMVHLALSSLEEQHHWLEEGLATYVEPIARVRSGELTAPQVWHDMIEGMPQGEPAPGDRGLDQTPTWGRTYWGGAMFCLLADVEIRKETNNRLGLENALRGIIAAGGTIDTEWGLARVLATGDQAIGRPVLETLYNRMKDDPAPVDLDSLWRHLGVEKQGATVVFHDDAPLAAIRRAIMAP
jgi:hypothetical protein